MQGLTANPIIEKWNLFNESLQQKAEGHLPLPFEPVDTLVEKYLIKDSQASILDVSVK